MGKVDSKLQSDLDCKRYVYSLQTMLLRQTKARAAQSGTGPW